MAKATSMRTRALAGVTTAGMLVVTLHSIAVDLPANNAYAVFTECADGIDNDHDSLIDYPQDPQCLSLHDDSEGPTGRGLFLSVTDGKAEVAPGGSLTYIIGLRTEREEPMSVDVFFQMPHQTNLIGTSDGGLRRQEQISWNNVTVFPGRLRQLTVTVEVDPDAVEGLLLVTEVVSEGEKATDTTRVELDDDVEIASRPSLNISVTDGKKFAEPGEVLNYVVSVRNPTNEHREYDLRLQIPTDTELIYVGGENQSSNRQAITWMDQQVGPHGAREYTVTLRIDNEVDEFVNIRTRASIAAISATDTTTVHTGVLPDSILVTTTDGLDEIVPGALVTYDIALQNLTNVLATEVDVNNALPTYLEFVDASEGGYWNGKNVRWQGLTVAPDGTRTLRVTGRVRSDAPIGEKLRNTVAVNGFQSVDTTVIGERVSGAGLARSQGVLVSKHADRSEVRPGETVVYTVSVQNTTNQPIYNMKVEDRMDSPYIRVLNASEGQTSGNGIVWSVPALEPGQHWSVNYTAQIDMRAPHGVTIPNIVTVSGAGMETVSLSERIHTMQIGVISNLPPTGAAFDAIFLGMTGLAGAAQTLAQKRKLIRK
ncbi:DUF11 domain-containing protein [Candidatus Peribacteria bacterium]|nr:DUF11 domain-containing protein [Candidatus Peribacteria bacterium]